MTDPLKRREFIKNLSLAGASIAIAKHVSPIASLPGDETDEIKNDHFTVSFDKKKGTINIYRNNGVALLVGGTACVNSGVKTYISSRSYKYSVDTKSFNDQNGPGKRLIILCKNKSKK